MTNIVHITLKNNVTLINTSTWNDWQYGYIPEKTKLFMGKSVFIGWFLSKISKF